MLARDDTQPDEPGMESNPSFLTPEEMAAAAVLSEKGDDFLMNGVPEDPTPPAPAAEGATTGVEADTAEGIGETAAMADGGTPIEPESTVPAAAEGTAPAEGAAKAAEAPDGFMEPFSPHFQIEGKTAAELDTEMDALEAKFDEGEVQGPEYRSQMRELQAAHSQATTFDAINTQTLTQRWDHAEKQFYAEGDGANSIFRDDAIMRGALDSALKSLYVSDEGKSEAWYLHQAATNVRATMGMDAPAPGASEDPPPLTKKNAGGRGDHAAAPTTLGNIPAADTHQEGGEFAGLDDLGGMEFEAAFANLSKQQQDKFLASET